MNLNYMIISPFKVHWCLSFQELVWHVNGFSFVSGHNKYVFRLWKLKITLAYWWSIIQDWPFYDGRSNEPLLYLFHFRTLLFQLPFTAGLINMIPRFVVCINAVHDFWWSMCFCVYRVFFINWYFERFLNYAGTHHQPFSDTTNDFGWPSLIRSWVNDGHYWIYQIRALHWC